MTPLVKNWAQLWRGSSLGGSETVELAGAVRGFLRPHCGYYSLVPGLGCEDQRGGANIALTPMVFLALRVCLYAPLISLGKPFVLSTPGG